MPLAFSFLSLEFLALAVTAVLALALLRGTARELAFLAANLVFLWRLALGPSGTVSTVAFALLGLLLVRVVAGASGRRLGLALAGLTLLFVLLRGYDVLAWVLPPALCTDRFATAGLSFLFFKVVHAMAEAASGTLGPLRPVAFLNYALGFHTFLMGPIQRFQEYRAQWRGERPALPPTFESHLDALLRVAVGLVKAHLLAPWIQPLTLGGQAQPQDLPFGVLLLGIYAFYVFLYLNFSGYCDVAIGIGSLLGVRPPENFDRPFLARDVSDFWLRMHRSLTLWLTDYVFSPLYKALLGRGPVAAHPAAALSVSLLLTMVVSGLWHGTTVSFLLFGVVHGLYLVVFRLWDRFLVRRLGRRRAAELRGRWWATAAARLLTFHAVSLAFVFFYLDAGEALAVLARLAGS